MGFLLLVEQKGNVYKKMQPHTKSLMGFLLGEKGRKEKKWNIIKTTGLYWIHPVSLSLSISSMQTNNNKRRRWSPIFVPSGRPKKFLRISSCSTHVPAHPLSLCSFLLLM
jgi:hypothetical protein